jgi:hypothetical protein
MGQLTRLGPHHLTHGQTHNREKRCVDWSSRAVFGLMVAAIDAWTSALDCWV